MFVSLVVTILGTWKKAVGKLLEEVSPDYEKKAKKLDSHVPGDATPF